MAPPIEQVLASVSIAELKALNIPENIITRNKRHEYLSNFSMMFMPTWAIDATLDFEMFDSDDLSLALLPRNHITFPLLLSILYQSKGIRGITGNFKEFLMLLRASNHLKE